MADPEIQRHPPPRGAPPGTVGREETVRRAVEGQRDESQAPDVVARDPSTRGGLTRALWRDHLVWGAIGFLIGCALGALSMLLPDPLNIVDPDDAAWAIVAMGVAFAIVIATIRALIRVAGEDQRVDEDVERRTGGRGRQGGP